MLLVILQMKLDVEGEVPFENIDISYLLTPTPYRDVEGRGGPF